MRRHKNLRHVVIVDDEPDLLGLIEDHFKEMGVPQISCFSSAQEAYDFCVKRIGTGFSPSVIISDLSMPEVTGLMFLEKLRANNFLRKIPFVLMTAFGEEEKIREAIRSGARDVLAKPFELSFLDERLSLLFDEESKKIV
jgi:two-component system chemotaxis response regulator CheY